MVSTKFKIAVKLSEMPAYRIAQLAGIHPATLSKLITGCEEAKPMDDRIIAVGKVLGIPASECFQEERANEKNQAQVC